MMLKIFVCAYLLLIYPFLVKCVFTSSSHFGIGYLFSYFILEDFHVFWYKFFSVNTLWRVSFSWSGKIQHTVEHLSPWTTTTESTLQDPHVTTTEVHASGALCSATRKPLQWRTVHCRKSSSCEIGSRWWNRRMCSSSLQDHPNHN